MSNITIVGGGLVGSLLAIFLAKRGHNVSVFERRGDPRTTDVYAGRSINLVVSHRGWTSLRAAGVEEAVKEIGKTQTVGNVRATFSAGRRTFDYGAAVGNAIETGALNISDVAPYESESVDYFAVVENAVSAGILPGEYVSQ